MSPIYLCSSCTTTLHSDRTTRRALRAISHCSLCQLQQKKKTAFNITGSRSHGDVDTDTRINVRHSLRIFGESGPRRSSDFRKRRAIYLVRSTLFLQQKTSLHFRHVALPWAKEKPANLEKRVRRIPSDTWRPRSIAKSTLNP